jgi:hypothetical protein
MSRAPSQRASQKPSRPASKSDSDAFDPMPCLRRFLSPSMQQLQQCALVDRELLQWLALEARHDAGDEPARQAQFDNGDQRPSGSRGLGDRLRSFNFCMGRSIGSYRVASLR